jgi:hypothetical protein
VASNLEVAGLKRTIEYHQIGDAMRAAVMVILLVGLLPCLSSAQEVLFSDDFQTDLSAWTTVGYGVLVADALNPSNQVITFSHTANSGNMWSPAIVVEASSTYVFSFRYRGAVNGVDSGGYLWLVDPFYGNAALCPTWGTQPDNSFVELIDDGAWHTYDLTFHVTDFFDPIGGTLKITLEDWDGAAGINPPPNIAGDAFFDDICLTKLDAVSSESASWGSIKSLFR